MAEIQSKTIIFTDGACSGNPGPGGWAGIVVSPSQRVTELGGGEAATTNNRMEMMAVLQALQFSPESDSIDIYTDSTYVIRGITQWIWGWRRRGWKTAEGQDVSNKDIWEELARAVQKVGEKKISWKYSRGHSGIPGNERCDEIAVAFSTGRRPVLFDGKLSDYTIDIMNLPTKTDLPEMKKPGEKKAAFSYLSNIGGIVYRHRDWGSCEKRVRGQSGAKFKKTTSSENELEVLKSWGLDTHTSIKE